LHKGFQSVFKPVLKTGFLYIPQRNPVFLNKNCTCTHDNINLFLRETRNVENRKPNYFYLLWRWFILFVFYIYKQQRSFVFCFCKRVSNLCWCFYVLYFSVFSASVCAIFFYFLIRSEGADNSTFIWCTIIGQHKHISNQHTSSQHIFSRTFSIATDDMTLSNELQNAISAVTVV
jgi:hypothetical protein